MNMLPANLPSVANAKLPANYEAARAAIAECGRIDECQNWADKAEVLASYAKQANDDELRKMADRIQARAIRRCGELLREIESASGRQQYNGTAPSRYTRTQAATEAGLSERQRKTALRVAAVPELEFDQQVESPAPPSVTALAEQGKASRPKPLLDLKGRDPGDFALATQIDGALRELNRTLQQTDGEAVVRGLFQNERKRLLDEILEMRSWLDALVEQLEVCDGV